MLDSHGSSQSLPSLRCLHFIPVSFPVPWKLLDMDQRRSTTGNVGVAAERSQLIEAPRGKWPDLDVGHLPDNAAQSQEQFETCYQSVPVPEQGTARHLTSLATTHCFIFLLQRYIISVLSTCHVILIQLSLLCCRRRRRDVNLSDESIFLN